MCVYVCVRETGRETDSDRKGRGTTSTMDGQYPHHLSYYAHGYASHMPTESYEQAPRLHNIQTMSMESMGSYSDFDTSNGAVPPTQGTQRSRRRQPPGAEHVKHRRTRSGCYTCRQRRVKVSHDTCGDEISRADEMCQSAMKVILPVKVCISADER